MKRSAFRLAWAAALALGSLASADDVKPLPSFAEPALSPDGTEIAFIHAGDIWVAPATGGTGHLLVSHPSNESRPIYSPDGKKLAFVSNRSGNGDIYILTFATGDLQRLTCDDGADQLDGWSADGKWVYFSSTIQDLGASNADIYRVRAEGGTPLPVSAERYTNEFHAAPSPDGKSLAMSAGASSREWWRNGHSNWNESHIWVRRDRGKKPAYEELTAAGAREIWPMWGEGGNKLFAVSDRDGKAQNIVAYDMTAPAPRKAEPLTTFTDGRVLWPSMSADGKTIVFERNFGIWRVSTAGGSPQELKITLRGAPNAQAIENLNFGGGFRDLAVSPDGKKLAFAVHGEIFAVSARDGGRATRVTTTAAAEGQVDWAPDSRRIVYSSERGDAQNLFVYDFATQSETPLTITKAIDSNPRFAPDGKTLIFRRNGTELRLLDLATKKDRLLVSGLAAALPPFDGAASPYAFSPKGQWLAYIDSGKRGFDHVFVVNTREPNAKPTQVTFFANTGSNSVSWAGDGRSLMFGTGMRTEEYQLARIDLIPREPNFSEDQFRGLFEDEMKTQRPGIPRQRPQPTPEKAPITSPEEEHKPDGTKPATQPATTQPTTLPSTRPATQPSDALARLFPSLAPEKFNLDNIRQRISLLEVGMDVDYQTVSPDGKWCAFVGSTGGKQNIYVYPLDSGSSGKPAVTRQLTSTTGGKGYVRFTPDSKDVYYLEGGQIRCVNLESRAIREIAVQAPLEVDFAEEKMAVARQAWNYLNLNFYDPKMHGVDWNVVWKTIQPRVAGAKTPDELRRILSLMIGELNASHTGITGGQRSSGTVGRLGLRYDRSSYEKTGVLKVTEALIGGPGEQAGIKPGESILAVDGDPLDEEIDLHKLLSGKIGRKVELRIGAAVGGGERTVALRPVDAATEKTLLYRAWVERNRQNVAKASGGRLGYVHIADMSANALTRLNADLDAEAATREGVVVDIRANTGGFASPYVLDVLSRKGYLTISRRGAIDSPGRTYVGQRALDLPTVLVTNRQSISDAENFTEGYRALKVGKVVGEPTAGGVIFTSEATLLDGSSLRIPFSKVTTRTGQNLEGEGRAVDVLARRKLGEGLDEKDSQLNAAVKTLLKQVDKGKPAK